MIRISLPYIFNLSLQLDPLASIDDKEAPLQEIYVTLLVADGALGPLVQGGLYSPYLRSSNPLGQELLSTLKQQTAKQLTDSVSGWEKWQIKNAYSQYKTVLLAELGSLDAYFVTQKGPYDSMALLAYGEALFPADLPKKVPEAIFDCRQAGQCLAYEVPTAAGFHAFRATESVLRKYYAHETNGSAPPKVRSIGVYVTAMEIAKKGDPKVLAVLKQLASLHRNPLIHPETVLTSDEAIAIFGIARSAMTAMLAALPVQPPTTTTPATVTTPSASPT